MVSEVKKGLLLGLKIGIIYLTCQSDLREGWLAKVSETIGPSKLSRFVGAGPL